jgi:hypothetical protein
MRSVRFTFNIKLYLNSSHETSIKFTISSNKLDILLIEKALFKMFYLFSTSLFKSKAI